MLPSGQLIEFQCVLSDRDSAKYQRVETQQKNPLKGGFFIDIIICMPKTGATSNF